jgi:hypothetical protein
MKKSLLLILFISITMVGTAQSSAEKAVADAVTAWRKAVLEADKTSLENLIAPELSYGHSNGKIDTKEILVQAVVTGKPRYKVMDLSDQTISVVGKTAIVRHKMTGVFEDADKTTTLKLFVLQIWEKRKGKWLLLARQAARNSEQ